VQEKCSGRQARSGGPLRSLTKQPVVRFPSPGSAPPLVGSACPAEFSPIRVAGLWLPAPPMPSAPRRWAPGCFPVRLPAAPKNGGSSPGLRLPYRVSDRSLRPTRCRAGSSHEVRSPTTTTPADPVHPGLPHPAPSGLGVWILPRRFAPCERSPIRRSRAAPGVHPTGLDPPTSRTCFQAVALMPFLGSPCLFL
jgi:hypothetical protein